MQQRWVKLQQLKMSSPLLRSLLLFLFFITGHHHVVVATAMAAEGVTCRQEIPSQLLRDLWSLTSILTNKLPEEENFHRRLRLLPKFCTKCPERKIGWLEVRGVIDVYQRSVFSTDVIQKLLPPHYNDLLYRLQYTLHSCVSTVKSSKRLKIIKRLERKTKTMKRDKVALKAVGEFSYVLRWIDELTQHHSL